MDDHHVGGPQKWKVEGEQTPRPFRISRRILVITSDPERREMLRGWLEKREFTVHEATDLHHAVQLISGRRTFAAIVCDQRMQDGDGMQFMHWLRREVFTMPFLLLTEWLLPGLKQRWDFDFLVAPIDAETLCAALGHLLGEEIGAGPIVKLPANAAAFPLQGHEENCA